MTFGSQMPTVKVIIHEDPDLGPGPDEDGSEVSLSGDYSDSGSLLSDDSILPDYRLEDTTTGTAKTLYQACAKNEIVSLRRVLDEGVMQEDVMELDINGRNGLMVAVSKGFVDIVYALNECPFLEINHSDNDGNTALMIAAQAGFVTILSYILNYFSGVDMEIRDNRGFTALIKAAIQGNNDCVASLLMAGADINMVDSTRGKDVKEWALKTGHFETFTRLRQLLSRPRAEQFCESYIPEWPELKQLVDKAGSPKSAGQKVVRCIKSTFTVSFPKDPQDNGVMDHMVRMTTSIHSPLVVTGCNPLSLGGPPEIGTRQLAVPELMEHKSGKLVGHNNGSVSSTTSIFTSTSSASLASCYSDTERSGSMLSLASSSMRRLVPRSISCRNSIFPSGCIPNIKVTKSADPTPKKEKKRKMTKGYLEPPVWKYKEAKLEKKKEKKRLEKEKADSEKADKEAKRKSKKV